MVGGGGGAKEKISYLIEKYVGHPDGHLVKPPYANLDNQDEFWIYLSESEFLIVVKKTKLLKNIQFSYF